MSAAATETLKKLIASSKVLVLSKTSCPYCSRTKSLLQEIKASGVTVVELDQRSDGSALQSAA